MMLPCLVSFVLALAPRQAAPPPDVLVIVADDVGWAERHLMPGLDRLATSGVEFDRAYTWPVCSPTRYATMFGRYPRRVGMGWVLNGGTIPNPPSEDVSLAEALLPTHATALVGKWHLGTPKPLTGELFVHSTGPVSQGWNRWLAGSPIGVVEGAGATGYTGWNRYDDGLKRLSTVYATHAQRDAFIQWWTNTTGPKLGWLAFSSAHSPYEPPPGSPPTSSPRQAYELMVADVDRAITAVLRNVDLRTTYVVYLGDNGTPDDVRPPGTPAGYWKGTTHEGGVRVPLIVAGPGIVPGRTERLVSMVDVPATLLELLGRTSRGFEDSQSFADELGPRWIGTPPRSFVFTEQYEPTQFEDRAVIEAVWKLRVWDPDGPLGPLPVTEALFHLPSDRMDQHPYSTTQPPLVRVADRLRAEMASIPPRR